MIKKILFTLAAVTALSLAAQVPTGVWKNHPTFLGSLAENMIETPQKVYFLSKGVVSCFDKATQQIESYTKGNTLNDVAATGIYYNYDHGYLLVTFINSNVNVIYDDGRVVTLSDLADVVMNTKKGINDVTFSGDSVMMATEFGYMIVNDAQWHVTESRNFGLNVASVAQVGERFLMSIERGVLASVDTKRTLSGFTDLGIDLASPRLCAIDDNRFLALGTGKIFSAQFNSEDPTSCDATLLKSSTATNIQPSPTGWIINCRDAKLLYTVDGETLAVTQTTIPAGSLYSMNPTGNGTPWILNNNGLYLSGTTTYFKPNAAEMRPEKNSKDGYSPLMWVTYNPESKKLYYQTTSDNALLDGPYKIYATINCYDGEHWSNALPEEMYTLKLQDISRLTFVPGHPEVYFTTLRDNYTGGFCRVIDGHLNEIMGNAAAAVNYVGWPAAIGRQIYPVHRALNARIAFDSKGNLWIATMRAPSTGIIPTMGCLPADKILKDTIYTDDWIAFPDATKMLQGTSFKHNSMAIGAGDVKVISSGNNSYVAYARHNDELTEQEVIRLDEWRMDNGTIFDPMTVKCLYTDRDRNVWMGTNDGVIYFDPSKAFDDDFTANMPLIGTNPLLKGEQVNCVAQDSLGRMWFGTNSQGVVVTNSTGTEILAHFLGDNSELPAMMIYDLCIADNSVFINTVNGLAEYDMNADVTPDTGIDYSLVAAAPLVIEPSYVAPVAINGLEDGSFVRITRRDGTVVAELTATGATAYWNYADTQGNRLPTGIYFIYAGADAQSLPGKPQAEVRIVK